MDIPQFRQPACPFLPHVTQPLHFSVTKKLRHDLGEMYHQAALSYAQSLWREGKPAQALLQLNKAWMADFTDSLETEAPYRALVWILRHSHDGSAGFLGNPVRHFQHLATRMAGPRCEIRRWRAWACFHLARATIPHTIFPKDGVQMAREGLWIPSMPHVLNRLAQLGAKHEADAIAKFSLSRPACP